MEGSDGALEGSNGALEGSNGALDSSDGALEGFNKVLAGLNGASGGSYGALGAWGTLTSSYLSSFLDLKKLLRCYLKPKKLLKKVHVNVPQESLD